MSLDDNLDHCKECIDFLVNNRYLDAVQKTKQFSGQSIYHSHCHSLLLWFKAYLTLEMPEILEAQKASEKTLNFCESIRPKSLYDNFFVKLIFDTDYDSFSEEEIHAELIRNELTSFSTLMEFAIDQSLFVLVKVSYRIRSCYMVLKSLHKAYEKRIWSSKKSRESFQGGVYLGLGMYNLLFSLLPDRIKKLLSIVGFDVNLFDGIRYLKECSDSDTLRSFPAQMLICAYECYFNQILNIHTANTPMTRNFVQNTWSQSQTARLALIEHDVKSASEHYEKYLQITTIDFKQMGNLYLWELMWCHALQSNWSKAYEFSNDLRKTCPWSMPSFIYIEAALLQMQLETRSIEEGETFINSPEAKEKRKLIDTLYKQVPSHVKRYAGRRIPIEKFFCERVAVYEKEGQLYVPLLELFLVWNQFIFIEGQEELVMPLLKHVERCLETFQPTDNNRESYLLLCLLKGICNRLINRLDQAESSLLIVIDEKEYIKRDGHLFSFALLELGTIKMSQRQLDEARYWFGRTKNELMHHPMELTIQLRLHSAFRRMRKCESN